MDGEFFQDKSVGTENLKKQDVAGSSMITSLVDDHVTRSAYCWQFWKKKDCPCEACVLHPNFN